MRPGLLPVLVAGAVLVAAIHGCSGGAPSTGAAPMDAAPDFAPLDLGVPDSEIKGLVAALNPGNILSYYVVWSTLTPASTALHVDCGDHQATIEGDGAGTDHEVFVMGLYANAECLFTAHSEDADGHVWEAWLSVTVPALPDALPPLELVVDGGAAVQPGWTLFNLTNGTDESPPIAAIVDGLGRYRWYHVRATTATGSGTPVLRVPDGILIGGSNDGGVTWPAIVDWEGRVIWEEELQMHHELLPWAEDGELLFLGMTTKCPLEIPDSSTIVRYDPETNETLWTWAFCEHYTPAEIGKDWDHTNAVLQVPNQDALLISAKSLDGLFKIDLATEDVAWRLGREGDFAWVGGGNEIPFLRQHAPEFVGDDEVLLFDNGADNVREESGAVQLRFDEETMTYEVTWSWYPDPPIFCHMWGDADRLENGNTLMVFGRRVATNDSHLIEVTMDGDEVWHLKTPLKWGWYRADRIAPLPAGYVVEN